MSSRMNRLALALVILALCLSACTPVPSPATVHPSQTVVPSATVTPTIIPTTSVIATRTIPALTMTSTKKPTQTHTITPTQPPTLTPLPTIPADEAQAYLRNLMLNNADCRLPCWWGITPGVTEWEEARQFLQSFASSIYYNESFPEDYNVEYGIVQTGYFFGAADYFVRNGTVISIVVNPIGTYLGYQLNQMLANYGEPDGVSIFTYPDYLSHGQLPFNVILRYAEENMTALYAFESEIIGDNVRSCPGYQPIGPWLFIGELQDPAEVLVYPDQALETATGMNVADFYQTYRTPDSTICLRTPINSWGWP